MCVHSIIYRFSSFSATVKNSHHTPSEHTAQSRELTPHRHENRRAEFPRSDGCGVTVPAPPAGDRPGRDADRSESLRCENATVARARAARRTVAENRERDGGRA